MTTRAENKSIEALVTATDLLKARVKHLEEVIGIDIVCTNLNVLDDRKRDTIDTIDILEEMKGRKSDRSVKSENKQQFRRKIKHCHNKSFKCIICDKSFNRRCKLEEHMNEHNTRKDFKCDLCESEFYLYWRFKKHLDGHLDTKRKFCHYFNNQKACLYEEFGCKFKHEVSEICVLGNPCIINPI